MTEEEKEEYELVPLSPIRKLEKRIEELEKRGITRTADEEIVRIMQTNQRIVDDLIKVNNELMTKLSGLMSNMQELVKHLKDFMERVEVVGEETPSEVPTKTKEKTEREKELEKKISKLEKRINALILSRIPKSRWEAMKKAYSPRAGT